MTELFTDFSSIQKTFEKHSLTQEKYQKTLFFDKEKNTVEYFPDKVDNLFWCIFIHKYSLDEYLQIGYKYKNREIEEKTKAVTYIKENIALMKQMKITKVDIQTMIGDLMTNEKTTLFSLQAMSFYFQLHIFLVCKETKTYIEYNPKEKNICLLYKKSSLSDEKNTKYLIDLQIPMTYVDFFQEHFLKYDTYDKMLKNVACYKKKDLDLIILKLGLCHNLIKPTKQDLYHFIATSGC